ncbi:MAG: trypsin-like peptidase domain-containing protein [Lachnospiraceae bacterium]|nr:trypsin-like peptidase domain-containing protein [Lachnospiraceae bacterium]
MDDNMNMNNDGFNETNTNETTNTYDNYRPAEPVNEAPADEVTVEAPAADTAPTVNQTVSWQGSSYSGTPAQDSAYSTYQSANAYSAYSSYYTNAQAAQNNTQAAARNTAQNDAYAQYAAGYGYVPGGSGPVQRPYTASVIPDAPKKEKKQRHMPGFLKVILAAALFGIVAAGVFMLTNELYYRINPSASPSSTASSGTIGGHASRTSKTTDANLVASTALITDINSAATDVSPVVESAMPSIVSIDCTFLNTSFFGTYESAGAGSGILLKKTDDELLIATNNHVVANSTSINVTFCDGSTASAVIKGTDAAADLAVISVNLSDLTSETLSAIKIATLGDSESIKVGQMVVAIGNSMGYGQSTTVGYVSAKDRDVTIEGTTMTLLQTDAAINPGNSGGALLNLNGEVIGINSAKYSDESVEGMGFAIPISRAVAILDELAARETLAENEKGYLGVYIKDVTSDMAAAYNIPVGAYVSDFVEGSPAKDGGIQVGDIITAVNGISITTSTDLKNAVTSYRAGTTVKITHYRLIDGQYTELNSDVTLIANPTTE